MKKLLVFVLLMFGSLLLISCENAIVIDLKSYFTNMEPIFSDPSDTELTLKSDLILKFEVVNAPAIKVTWSSSDQKTISNLGTVDRGTNNENVTLTLTLANFSKSEKKVFTYTVLARDSSVDDELEGYLSSITVDYSVVTDNQDSVTGDLIFNDELLNADVIVTWISSHIEIIASDGKFFEPVNNTLITITARLTLNQQSIYKTFTFNAIGKYGTQLFVQKSVNYSDNQILKRKANVYYLGETQIPYVDLTEFLSLIKENLVQTITSTPIAHGLEISYLISETDAGKMKKFTMQIDFDADLVTVNDFGFFSAIAGFALVETSTDNKYFAHEITKPTSSTTINLKNYGFDLIASDKHYLPLALANQFFSGDMFDVVFNGSELVGMLLDESLDSDEKSSKLKQLMTTSKYSLTESTLEFRKASYNFLMLAMDYFYGLQDKVDGGALVVFDKYYQDFIKSDLEMAKTYQSLINDLDDLHTWINSTATGYFNFSRVINNANFTSHVNLLPNHEKTLNFYNDFDEGTNNNSIWNFDLNTVQVNTTSSDIAFIFIPGFDEYSYRTNTFTEVVKALKALPGHITKVVFDLAYNGGGIVDYAIEIALLTTKTAKIDFVYQNPVDKVKYTISYQPHQTINRNFKYTVLTSGATYSAANLMTSLVKEYSTAKIVGKQSSGGAAIIDVLVGLDGTVMCISSNMYSLNSKDFSSIENGISVDTTIKNFWDLNLVRSYLEEKLK